MVVGGAVEAAAFVEAGEEDATESVSVVDAASVVSAAEVAVAVV